MAEESLSCNFLSNPGKCEGYLHSTEYLEGEKLVVKGEG